MYNIDGTLHAKSGTHYVDLEIATNAQTHVCRFLLMDLSDNVIVLGFPWLCKFEPQISWRNAHFGPEYSDVRFKTIPPRPRSDAGQSSSAAQLPPSLRYPLPSVIWVLTRLRRLLRRLLHLDLGDVPSADSRTLTVELLQAWHIGLVKPR
jgi:hypothetical protein